MALSHFQLTTFHFLSLFLDEIAFQYSKIYSKNFFMLWFKNPMHVLNKFIRLFRWGFQKSIYSVIRLIYSSTTSCCKNLVLKWQQTKESFYKADMPSQYQKCWHVLLWDSQRPCAKVTDLKCCKHIHSHFLLLGSQCSSNLHSQSLRKGNSFWFRIP